MNDIHPTATGGDGRIAPRRTTYKPGDNVLDILHCVNCGLPFRVGKDTEGDSTESPGISYATNSAVGTNFLRNGNFQTWSLGTSFTDRHDNFTTADGWDIYENGITAFNSITKDSTVTLNGLPTLRLEPNMNLINVFTVSATPTTMVTGGTYLVPTNTLTVTLNMPAAAANVYFIVRDIGNNASGHNITLHRNGSESIDGTAADKTLSTNNGQWLILSDGTNWYTLLNAGLTSGTQTIAGAKTFSSDLAVNSASSTAFLVSGSANGINPRGIVTNTNTTAGQQRIGLVGASGDNGSISLSLLAGKDAANNAVQMVSADTFVSLGIGATEYGRQTTAQFLNQDGTAGNPTFSFISDPDTGVYHSNTNRVGISTGGFLSSEFATSGTADDTHYAPQTWFSANGGEVILDFYSTASVTTAKKIATVPGSAELFLVYGDSGGGATFFDLVMCGGASSTPTVVTSKTIAGSPAARTYSMAGANQMSVAMGSGTYTIRSYGIGIV